MFQQTSEIRVKEPLGVRASRLVGTTYIIKQLLDEKRAIVFTLDQYPFQ